MICTVASIAATKMRIPPMIAKAKPKSLRPPQLSVLEPNTMAPMKIKNAEKHMEY